MKVSPTSRRRIVRRAVIAVAVVVLLPVFYVVSAISVSFAVGAGWLPDPAASTLGLLYAPLEWYIVKEYPGWETVEAVFVWANKCGDRFAN